MGILQTFMLCGAGVTIALIFALNTKDSALRPRHHPRGVLAGGGLFHAGAGESH